MNTIFYESFTSSGGLGDSYIITLKLLSLPKNIKAKVSHFTHPLESRTSAIRQILKFSERVIEVNFVPSKEPHPELTTNPKDCSVLKTIYFPELFKTQLPPHNSELFDQYTVVVANSGNLNGRNYKILKERYIKNLKKVSTEKIILLGTFEPYRNFEVDLNLIGQTSIREACEYVAGADKFIGPEGLLSFAALSHKVSSKIFYTSRQAIDKRILGTLWEKYANLISDRKGSYMDSVLTNK